MKQLWITILCSTLSFASIDDINSFKADFIQSVTDDKNISLNYSGHISASKPQNAIWNYVKPIKKDVYINKYRVIVVEPEIEQVIIRKIKSNFDFFMMIKNAVQIDKNKFENDVKISFKNQKQNIKIDKEVFVAKYPLEFDIIRD